MTLAPSPVRLAILLTAERLFSRQGINGTSLRQISAASGQGNTSAVQYHFGTKDDLVHAIVDYRVSWLIERRRELMQDMAPTDVSSWVRCQVTTIMELADQPDSHYLGFVSELWHFGPKRLRTHPDHLKAPVESFHARLSELLVTIPEPIRSHRIGQAETLMIHAAAQRERARDEGMDQIPLDLAIDDLIDGTVGFLEASSSIDRKTAVRFSSMAAGSPLYLTWPYLAEA